MLHKAVLCVTVAALLMILTVESDAADAVPPTPIAGGLNRSAHKQQGLDALLRAAALNAADKIHKQLNPLLYTLDKIRPNQESQQVLRVLFKAPATSGSSISSKGSRRLFASNSTEEGTVSGTNTNITTSSSSLSTIDKTFNCKTIQSFTNLLMSDAWMIIYNGLSVLSICIKFLALTLTSLASGQLVVDAGFVLDLADLAAGLGAEVSWLLNSAMQTSADATSPLGLIKPEPLL